MRHVSRVLAIGLLSFCVVARPAPATNDGADLTLEDIHVLCYGYLYGGATEKNFAKALPWCTFAAEHGVPSAEVLLAEIYYFGRGVPRDASKAAYWYEKAAATGHTHAEFMLYQLYVVDGVGGPDDAARGLEMLKKAADAGYEKARTVLAKSNGNSST